MKIRHDFVTNSSSSSFIICFARIQNERKAEPILKKHHIYALTAEEIMKETDRYGDIKCEWAGAGIYDLNRITTEYPDSRYILEQDQNDADYDDDDLEPIYDYDFASSAFIDDLTEENGFANIQIREGEGRNG